MRTAFAVHIYLKYMTWTTTVEECAAPEQCTCNCASYFDHMFHWWLKKNQALLSLCCHNAAYVWGSYTPQEHKKHPMLHCQWECTTWNTYFPFPNQLPTQATTAGQPVVCIRPFMTCRMEQTQGEKTACINKTASETHWVVTLKLHNPVHNHAVIWSSCESCDKREESQTKGPSDLWRDFK